MSTYAMEHEHIAFWILVAGAILDETAKFLKKESGIKTEEQA